MKKYAILLIFLSLLITIINSCEKDSGIGQFDDVVIESETNQYKFRQITFIVSLKNQDYGYLNLALIDSMKIYVNAQYWGTFSSESIDTTGNTDRIVNHIMYSDKEINYLILAPYVLSTDNLETAGDFVNYLKDRITLVPGDYICEIKEIKIKNLNGDWITDMPQIFANFTVIENTSSSYVGNIEIPVEF